MNEEKKEKIWTEIQDAVKERGRKSGERTIPELMKLWGMRRDKTKRIVNELVEAGILMKRIVGENEIYFSPNDDIANFEEVIHQVLVPKD